MKIFPAIFIFIFCFSACGKIETLTNLTQQKIETEKTETEQPDGPPILEIRRDARGLWSFPGKTLFFNLYENGVIKFEYEDEKKIVKGKINQKAEEISTPARAKISSEELQKFNELLKSEDFQKTKVDYKRKCCCTDAFVDFKISFTNSLKQKIINLNNYCGLGELTNPQAPKISDFPKVLTDLLILTENLRAKYLPEKSSNQPE
ncbi:MAG TPA: hypothetical protein VGC76_13630 [Pyrinomonadaceae bacterium]|jgi:hypothetical protein